MSPWVVAVGWAVGWVLLWRLPRLLPARASADRGPTVSVIVPARNEADRLPVLLGALADQHRRPDQVVVVDDASEDGTAAAAARFPGVEVIGAPPVPEGWAGKPWACATGSLAARGDVLVFLDADVDLDPSAIGSLLATWDTDRGLVSVQPHHHIRRPVEALSLPFNVVSMMGLGVGSVLPPSREWGAAGPCLVTGRTDYEHLGGHGSVAGEVAEDLALAERYREAGLPVTCLGGHDVVRYRMYRDAGSVVEGWSKNLVTGARRTPLLRTVAIALWVTALLVMGLRLTTLPTTSDELAAWGLVYAAGVVQLGLLGRRVGRFGPASLAWPLLMVFFVGVFVLSAVRTLLLRQVRWSGRQIPVAAGRR